MIQKYFLFLVRSLAFKIFLILLVMVVMLFMLNATISWQRQLIALENNVKLCGYKASEMVKQSFYRMMLLNERENLYQTILILGNEPKVANIRILNKAGEIKFSDTEQEIGNIVDLQSTACKTCHATPRPVVNLPIFQSSRIIRVPSGERFIELINPIKNAPECSNAACHAHDAKQTVLGILEVQMSLSDLDAIFFESRQRAFISSLIFLVVCLVLIGLLTYFALSSPIKKLRQGTIALANGNLNHRIELQRRDELGLLAQSFNSMAQKLQQAYEALMDWSSELERRVQAKSQELERLHRGMLQVEKMASLGTLAATVAHELNNPIAGIVTYASFLQKKLKGKLPADDAVEIQQDLEIIRSESLRCGNIVRDLLLFARESSVKFQHFGLSHIIERALAIVKHHLELANVQSELQNNLASDEVVVDVNQMEQAFVAIFVNAVEAMPGGGKLMILMQPAVSEPLKKVRIEIRDTGVGIPPEIQNKIFEPFYSTKKNHKGVGLGLAVVYGIIQRHQGKIWFESQTGQGTTFFIEIPKDVKP